MSKALEAFGRITLHTEYDNDSHYDGLHFEDDCNLVDKALERLEQIDNAKPSEALKCLEILFSNVLSTTYNRESSLKDFNTIKQALLNAEKEHKALEIIKKTKNIKVSFYENGSGKHYKIEFDKTRNQTITKEEFNLLKGILNDEQ